MSMKYMQDSKEDCAKKLEELKQDIHIAIKESVLNMNAPWEGALFGRGDFANRLG